MKLKIKIGSEGKRIIERKSKLYRARDENRKHEKY